MFSKSGKSKFMPITVSVFVIGIIVLYSIISSRYTDNTVFYCESAVCIIAGLIFTLGLYLINKVKKMAGIIICCIAYFLPILVNPYLTAGYKSVPYVLQATLYMTKLFTACCPFLAVLLLKAVSYFANKMRYKIEFAAICYYIIAFSAAILLQNVLKWQYKTQYGYETTWNAVETFYQILILNVIFIHCAPRYISEFSNMQFAKHKSKSCTLYTIIANIAALFVLILNSTHLKNILSDFVGNLIDGGISYALRETTWLAYRFEIFDGIINGKCSVGVSTFLSKFPNEFPIYISWDSEPLVSARLTYGWTLTLLIAVLYILLITSLLIMRFNDKKADEIGWCMKCSFVILCCLSFAVQFFLPTYELFTPLIGNGSCMIFVMIVYCFLPKVMTTEVVYD